MDDFRMNYEEPDEEENFDTIIGFQFYNEKIRDKYRILV